MNYKPRGLNIVPACLTVTELADDKHPLFFMMYSNMRFGMVAPGHNYPSIAFFIRLSETVEDCNCVLKTVRSESGEFPAIIECAVISNNKAIKAGDELVLYREKVTVEKTKTVRMQLDNVALQPPCKKARTSPP